MHEWIGGWVVGWLVVYMDGLISRYMIKIIIVKI